MMSCSKVFKQVQQLSVLLVCIACNEQSNQSDTPENPTSNTAAGATTSSSSGTGEPALSDCVSDLTVGEDVTVSYVKGSKPDPAGGLLVDGVYDLTSWTVYGQETGPERASSRILRINGNQLASVSREAGDTNEFTANYRIMETAMLLKQVCPEVAEASEEGLMYSATASQLSIFTDDGEDGTILTYTRR